MKLSKLIFGRWSEVSSVSDLLDEKERELAEQQLRLRRIRHLIRERELYERRRREST